MKRSAQLEATLSELEKHGAVYLRTEQNRHVRVFFRYRGEEQFVIIAASCSDERRGADNARKSVRRQLGIKGRKTTGARRTRRNYIDAAAPTPPEHITIKADPWASIKGSRIAEAATALAADRAWSRLFGLCLREVGHVPLNPDIWEASA